MMRFLVVSTILAAVLLASVEQSAAQGKKVVCYYGTWAVYRPGDGKFDVEDVPIDLCTHIIYGFTDLQNNQIALYDPWNDITDGGGKGALLRFTGLKTKNPNLKTLVANGGWNAGSTKYSTMAANPAARTQFVNSVVAFVRQYGFDGFDFDWEYPGCTAVLDQDRVCVNGAADKANYISLLTELKAALSPSGYILTAAVHCGKKTIDNGYDIPKMVNLLDQFHVMTYDYHGAWETVTGLNSPLYSNPSLESGDEALLNADWTVNYWMSQGVPASKIIMGAAVYGRGFTLDNPSQNGLLAPASKPIPEAEFTRQNGSWGYNEICREINKGGWTVVRDSCYQAPYAYNGNLWIGYDDIQSTTLKGQYISAKNLGGVMIWEVDTDDFKGTCHGQKFPLIRAAIAAMNAPASLPPKCQTGAITTPSTGGPKCSVNGAYYADPADCQKYYQCVSGELKTFYCGPGLAFNVNSKLCDYPSNVPGCSY